MGDPITDNILNKFVEQTLGTALKEFGDFRVALRMPAGKMTSSDVNGDPIEDSPLDLTPNTPYDVVVANDLTDVDPGTKLTISIVDSLGNPVKKFGFYGESVIDPALNTDIALDFLNQDLNELNQNDAGKAALKTVPEQVSNSLPKQELENAYSAAQPVYKNAVGKMASAADVPMTKAMKKAVSGTSKKQDGSRTSREYHEWKYCCILSNNYSILRNLATGKSINYEGVDPETTAVGVDPSSSTVPPYHAWVQYEDLRKACNLVKKIRRNRSRCGGLELLQDQGFADKTAAISNDLENSAEWDTLRAALDAFADFAEL